MLKALLEQFHQRKSVDEIKLLKTASKALRIDSKGSSLNNKTVMINWLESCNELANYKISPSTVWISGKIVLARKKKQLLSERVGVLCHLNAVKQPVTKSSHSRRTSLLFMCQLRRPTAS